MTVELFINVIFFHKVIGVLSQVVYRDQYHNQSDTNKIDWTDLQI